jgi:hypothetical protein
MTLITQITLSLLRFKKIEIEIKNKPAAIYFGCSCVWFTMGLVALLTSHSGWATKGEENTFGTTGLSIKAGGVISIVDYPLLCDLIVEYCLPRNTGYVAMAFSGLSFIFLLPLMFLLYQVSPGPGLGSSPSVVRNQSSTHHCPALHRP